MAASCRQDAADHGRNVRGPGTAQQIQGIFRIEIHVLDDPFQRIQLLAGRHGRRKVFQLATEKGRRYDKGREQCPFTEIAKTDGRIAFFSQVLTKLQPKNGCRA